MRLILACVAIVVFHGAALGDGHPYAGLWSEDGIEDLERPTKLSGASGCYNKFTEQLPDGQFRYYLVDHETWLGERKIEYLLAQEGTCQMNPDGHSEKCVGRVMGERQSEWYIAYQSATSGGVKATYYENVFYFEKRFNGEPIFRHKCPFDISKIKQYISGRTIADCTTRCRAFGRSESAEFDAMLEALQGDD